MGLHACQWGYYPLQHPKRHGAIAVCSSKYINRQDHMSLSAWPCRSHAMCEDSCHIDQVSYVSFQSLSGGSYHLAAPVSWPSLTPLPHVRASTHVPPLLHTPEMQSWLTRHVAAKLHCLMQSSPQSSAPSVAVSQTAFVQVASCWHTPLPQIFVLQSQVDAHMLPTPHAAPQPPPPLQTNMRCMQGHACNDTDGIKGIFYVHGLHATASVPSDITDPGMHYHYSIRSP